MGEIDLLALLLRWMHILAATAAVGGTLFMRLALLPASLELSGDEHRRLHEGIRSRWSKVVMIAITFLLVSGVYNVGMKLMTKPGVPVLYHIVFTVKFLLALGVFFISSALTGKSPSFAAMRERRKYWLSINLALAVTVVLLSGLLRAIPPKAATVELPTVSVTGPPQGLT